MNVYKRKHRSHLHKHTKLLLCERFDCTGQQGEEREKASLGEDLRGYLVGLAELVWVQAEQGITWGTNTGEGSKQH